MLAKKNDNDFKMDKEKTKRVISYCKQVFVEQIGNGFNHQLDDVLRQIKILSEETAVYSERQIYNRLYEFLSFGRHQMSIDFKSHLNEFFDKKVNDNNKKDMDFENLLILSDEEVEQDVAAKELEKTIADALGDELQSLAIRMKMMSGDDYNPFSPEVLSMALSSAVKKTVLDEKIKKHAFQIFGKVWTDKVKVTYQGINKYMIENDIVPDIKKFLIVRNNISNNSIDMESQNNSKISKLSQSTHSHVSGRSVIPKSDMLSLENDEINNERLKEIFEIFPSEKMIRTEGTENLKEILKSIVKQKQDDLGPDDKLDIHELLMNSSILKNTQTLNLINKYQEKILDNNLQMVQSGVSMNMLESDLNSIKNIINKIKEDKSYHNNDYMDQVIMDLLINLFERIFEETELPQHIKFLIGKLQIPVLKACLLNKTMFMKKDNAIRKFLDYLASRQNLFNEECIKRYEAIINEILKHEHIDEKIFEHALIEIENLLKEYSQKESFIVEKESASLLSVELKEQHYDQVLAFSQKTISRARYAPLKAFMEKVWARAFASVFSEQINNESNDFMTSLPLEAKVHINHALLIFDMMIWTSSIQEKNPANLEKMHTFMPKIVDGIRKICLDLQIARVDEDNLMYLLAEKHLNFLKNNTEEENLLPNTPKPINFKNKQILEEKRVVDQYTAKDNAVESIKNTNKEIANKTPNFDTLFSKDNWFDFNESGSKVKLIWVSPKKTLFLFLNPQTKVVIKMDKTQLWQSFQNKSIEVVQSKNLDTQGIFEIAMKEIAKKVSSWFGK